MLRIWSRKGKAVRKWRSRAWSIDPKKTKLTIIKSESLYLYDSAENVEIADLNLTDPTSILPLYMNKSPLLLEFCAQGVKALTDMEEAFYQQLY